MNRRVKSLLFVISAVFVVMIGWHGVTRLISPWTVVRTLTTSAAIPPLTQLLTLRVGTYNIAEREVVQSHDSDHLPVIAR